jgi:glycosyltransferase involved in cell wall biosynthesis
LFESVPPQLYGGTERVIGYLTDELVRLGHEVTLFASGDSHTLAKLAAGTPAQALRLSGRSSLEGAAHLDLLRLVLSRDADFELVHLHVDDWFTRESRLRELTTLTTVHGRLDTDERRRAFAREPELPLVSISDAQRAPLPRAAWLGTVYHGLPMDHFVPRFDAGTYLVFLGRIYPEKGLERAVEVARCWGMPLKVAAKVETPDDPYYRSIEHLLKGPEVEFVGEVDEARKNELLSHAYALLFPVSWPEPFGLAMVESMSCGTPVIAWRHGSTPEIVDEGLTGYLVDDCEGGLAALESVATLDRKRVARIARQRFSARRMALDYLRLYERCLRHERESSWRDVGGGIHAGPRE